MATCEARVASCPKPLHIELPWLCQLNEKAGYRIILGSQNQAQNTVQCCDNQKKDASILPKRFREVRKKLKERKHREGVVKVRKK
jgi:hypothetical protein